MSSYTPNADRSQYKYVDKRQRIGDKTIDKHILYRGRVYNMTKSGRIPSCVIVVLIKIGNKFGIGIGKSSKVNNAIDIAVDNAKKNLLILHRLYNIQFKYGASKLIIRKTSIQSLSCANYLYFIFQYAGIDSCSCKIIGSSNKMNNIFCLINAFKYMNSIYDKDVIFQCLKNSNYDYNVVYKMLNEQQNAQS